MSESAKRVVSRFVAAKKPMAPEKLQALLLKLRKGADSAISMPQLVEVLDSLGGWKVEPFVGLVQLHGHLGREDAAESVWDNDADDVRRKWEESKKDEVSSLPSSPRPGERYTMRVTDVTSEGWALGLTGYKQYAWMGAKGLKFTSPENKVFELLPGKFDLVSNNGRPTGRNVEPMKMPLYRVRDWLYKETSFLNQVNKALNMPSVDEEKKERERAKLLQKSGSIGTCPCCFGYFKLAPRTKRGSDKSLPGLVLHGYQRPGDGMIHGDCFGMEWPPFELSKEGTEAYINSLEDYLVRAKAKTAQLRKRERTEMGDPRSRGREFKLVKKDEVSPQLWKQWEDQDISRAEGTESNIEMALKMTREKLATWELKPLPKG